MNLWRFKERTGEWGKIFFLSYSQLFFIDDWRCGILIMVGSFLDFNVGLAGLLSGLATLAFGSFLGLRKKFQWPGHFIYNPILAGMTVGYLFRIDVVCLPFLLTVSLLTFMVTVLMNNWLSFLAIPVLSLPFSLVSLFFFLAARSYSALFDVQPYHVATAENLQNYVPSVISGFFRALSTILYTPDFKLGLGLAALILIKSRLLFLALFYGFILGTGTRALLLESWDLALGDSASFNYAFTAAAIGTIFLIPSLTSFAVATVGIIFSVILADSMKSFSYLVQTPVFALPFNGTVFLIVHTFHHFQSKWITRFFGSTPEETREIYLSKIHRFGYPHVSIHMPVAGLWAVEQGFDGKKTHTGIWCHAIDFVKIDEAGKKFKNSGLELTDHYTFGSPAYAPCSGYVVALEASLPDNPIGQINACKNWGNFILIRSDVGFYVLLSHLKKSSLQVLLGQYLYSGSPVAECGNSGYSSEPHLHVHVQAYHALGSPTIPFTISSFICGQLVQFNTTPRLNQTLEAFPINQSLNYAFSWLSGREFHFARKSDGMVVEFFRVITDEQTGKSCLEDGEGNRAYFWQEYPVFYFYEYRGRPDAFIAKIFMAMPRFAQTFGRTLQWFDEYPLQLRFGRLSLILEQIAMLISKTTKKFGHYQIEPSGTTLQGLIFFQDIQIHTKILLDPLLGIKEMNFGTEEYVQVTEAA